MTVLMKMLGFSAVLILTFTGVTYLLPQMVGTAPAEREVDIGGLTMESFISMGEELYEGQGSCALCHNALGRAPDLLAFDVTAASLQRLADPRYKGDASDPEDYLRESMLRPSVYVVEGFGTKGSKDTESPMPASDKPPIQLSELAIDAIIAYLQDKDGHAVTVPLPTETAQSQDEATAATPERPKSPEEVMANYACAACHSILAGETALGPDLSDIGRRQSIRQIRESIVKPGAIIDPGYVVRMPDFPNMTIAELEMIVDFLALQTGAAL